MVKDARDDKGNDDGRSSNPWSGDSKLGVSNLLGIVIVMVLVATIAIGASRFYGGVTPQETEIPPSETTPPDVSPSPPASEVSPPSIPPSSPPPGGGGGPPSQTPPSIPPSSPPPEGGGPPSQTSPSIPTPGGGRPPSSPPPEGGGPPSQTPPSIPPSSPPPVGPLSSEVSPPSDALASSEITPLPSILTGGLGVFLLVIAYGTLKGKRWSWTLIIVLSIVSIVLNAILITTGTASLFISTAILLIISGIILYYFFRPHVKAYFDKIVSSAMPASQTTTMRRPPGVTIIAIGSIIIGGIMFLFGLAFVVGFLLR